MHQYQLRKRDGCFYVAGLIDSLLIVHYPEGDVNTVSTGPGERMHRALYDLYQVNDALKDGDEFLLQGKVVYRCQGVHVVTAGVIDHPEPRTGLAAGDRVRIDSGGFHDFIGRVVYVSEPDNAARVLVSVGNQAFEIIRPTTALTVLKEGEG